MSRIIELDGDQDLKPLVAVREAAGGQQDGPDVQPEDQRYFRQHVQLDVEDTAEVEDD